MKDLNATVEDDSRKWTSTWEPMIARVGSDLSEGELTWGADEIEPGAIRRYLEPLELDCPLHYDREVARAYGFSDVTAPYTSILTFTIPAMWNPGQRLFTSHDRDAQPASSPINGDYLRVARASPPSRRNPPAAVLPPPWAYPSPRLQRGCLQEARP